MARMGDDLIQTLAASECMNVRSFRKDGSPVDTPMWVVELDGRLCNYTDERTYKVKRITRNPEVEVAACNVWGKCSTPWYPATCRFVEGESRRVQVFELLRKKYGIHWYMSLWGSKLTGKVKYRRVLEFELAPR
jgi:PPOX class probable F420-dependent enzyme